MLRGTDARVKKKPSHRNEARRSKGEENQFPWEKTQFARVPQRKATTKKNPRNDTNANDDTAKRETKMKGGNRERTRQQGGLCVASAVGGDTGCVASTTAAGE